MKKKIDVNCPSIIIDICKDYRGKYCWTVVYEYGTVSKCCDSISQGIKEATEELKLSEKSYSL